MSDEGDFVGRESSLRSVLSDHLLVCGDVGTGDLVLSHVALDLLNLRAHALKNTAGRLRDGLELF